MPAFEDQLPFHPFGARILELRNPPETGTDVKVLQTLYNQLLAITHPPGGAIGTPLPADGVFGPATADAVRRVQSYFGLTVDGVVGPETFLAFGQAVDGHVTYGGPRFGSRTLRQGDSGGDVVVLQNRLNLFRYAIPLGAAADGDFGPRTAQAVLEFKADALANGDTGLAPNAVVGLGTLDALWIYTYAGGRNLERGSVGLDVAFVQAILANLTNPGTGRPFYAGAVDGFFGPLTAAAVRAFQSSVGIAVDGVVGRHTYHQLGLHNAVPAPQPAPVPPV
jgi:peptidoglycan hydrolase-like protein with peptidoglycan-binding domain